MKIAALICNYNGKQYALDCIRSLKEQTLQNFDILLVDNASTDGTADAVSEQYKDVEILRNKTNLGGTGGFNAGLRHCREKGYEYVLMLDNDVKLKENALEELLQCMKANPSIGILGAKIMILDAPEYIQEYGSYINFKYCRHELGHCGKKDSDVLSKLEYCDYVPACAALLDMKMIDVAGYMPNDTFIYWDDIEFCYEIKQHGYQVAACGQAYAWHRGAYRRPIVNTFGQYYFTRNRVNFFLKTASPENIRERAEIMLYEISQTIYGSKWKGMDPLVKTLLYAFWDAADRKRGKAEDNKIFPFEEGENRLNDFLKKSRKVCITPLDFYAQGTENQMPGIVSWVCMRWHMINPGLQIDIDLSSSVLSKSEFEAEIDSEDRKLDELVKVAEYCAEQEYDKEFILVKHVSEVKENRSDKVYIDRHLNYFLCQEDFEYFHKFEETFEWLKLYLIDKMIENYGE